MPTKHSDKNPRGWLHLRRGAQIVFFLLFLVLFLKAEYAGKDILAWPVDLFFRFNPLVLAAESNFEAEPRERLALAAAALRSTLRRISVALGKPAYNFMVHSNPLRDAPSASYQWHLEVMPALTQVAGFEWGSGFYINPVPPEEAAEFLRKVAS